MNKSVFCSFVDYYRGGVGIVPPPGPGFGILPPPGSGDGGVVGVVDVVDPVEDSDFGSGFPEPLLLLLLLFSNEFISFI
ncbi:hypothetical protein [Brevibacillus brevis]|uniref:Uncharacterized protein n=1 Tax=Brevibacillus brevis TaxID=1393 RepID=A0A517I1G6_BREBE|nr:hypothetical protein [Brevibacillus brevis]QDS32749.1 hypothetical protein FPS98_01460 [Brevibacillus brevis]